QPRLALRAAPRSMAGASRPTAIPDQVRDDEDKPLPHPERLFSSKLAYRNRQIFYLHSGPVCLTSRASA
ncbi:hypothetical protein, partial [Novosphingobium sp. ZW T3_23]|uniref:hypothetical protein n=1 Tax=Novosphingobium sp. ZW T3_23 TaxID=3378084 RepID=UPI0038548941